MDIDTLVETCYTLFNERQVVFKNVKNNEEAINWQKENLSFFRNQIEPYVFNYLNLNYGKQLDEFWKTHTFPKKSNRALVLIERRAHPNMWFTLRNIAWAAPNLSLYIFCSDMNYNFIKTLLGDKADNVHIIKWFRGLADKHTGIQEGAITLQMASFYDLIDAEYIINVHVDAYFIQKIPDWIFTGTYYGSPWGWNQESAGNGGLAVRHIKKMSMLCQKEAKNFMSEMGEDAWISAAIVKHGFDLPPLEFRIKVFQESFPTNETPIGTHQFWTYIMNYNLSNRPEFHTNIKKLVTMIGI